MKGGIWRKTWIEYGIDGCLPKSLDCLKMSLDGKRRKKLEVVRSRKDLCLLPIGP